MPNIASDSAADNPYVALTTVPVTDRGLGVVHLRSVPQKDPNDVRLISSGGKMKGSLPPHCRVVWIRSVLNEKDGDVHVTHERSNVQRSQTRL